MSRQELRERNDRLLRDYDAAPAGRRHHLVARYGFANIRSLDSKAWLIRKRRAAEGLSSSEERYSVRNG